MHLVGCEFLIMHGNYNVCINVVGRVLCMGIRLHFHYLHNNKVIINPVKYCGQLYELRDLS